LLYSILSFAHPNYGHYTSLKDIASHWNAPLDNNNTFHSNILTDDHMHPAGMGGKLLATDAQRRANATFIMLARNSDIDGAVRSIRQMEERFNRQYNYPYVFLNEEPFTEEFKK
jgi:alpha 1,2-mannosyltransferase